MIIKANNNISAETVFVAFKNVSGAGSITQNDPMCYHMNVNSIDGISAQHPVTAGLAYFSGIARSSVAINGTGLATAWGYHNSIHLSQEVTSITITAGDLLQVIAGTGLGMSSIGGATFDWVVAKYASAGTTINMSINATGTLNYVSNCIVRAI